ncbi:hypothetical protein M2171_004286 [Bradyrhizobium japonicum USDA 38]|nr:hypothetical protein [Bradyrhizobium japonicum USDA 38]MCS3947668.1 hypothetical protein [Bradyrhizobium japonicum]
MPLGGACKRFVISSNPAAAQTSVFYSEALANEAEPKAAERLHVAVCEKR